MEDKIKITESFTPSKKEYEVGMNAVLAIGCSDESNGIFVEWLGVGRIVVRIDGKDYKQTIEEFVNNCK